MHEVGRRLRRKARGFGLAFEVQASKDLMQPGNACRTSRFIQCSVRVLLLAVSTAPSTDGNSSYRMPNDNIHRLPYARPRSIHLYSIMTTKFLDTGIDLRAVSVEGAMQIIYL